MTPMLYGLLGGLVLLYVLQLLAQSWLGLPVLGLLALWAPFGPQGWTGMFLPWQPISALLVNGDPGTALLDWLMLWFFLPPALDRLGRRGLAKLLAFSWVVGVLVGFALSWPGIALPGSPYLGLTCLTTALIVVFGLAMPQARILLFFVLPIRAIWIVWVEIFLLALYFLAYRSLESAVNLAGVLAAFAWMRFDGSPSALLLRARLAWLRRRRTQARGRFDVIEGGRGDSSGWVH